MERKCHRKLPREIDLDPKNFLEAVEKHAAAALASVPLTLGFLINRFVRQKSISTDRAELYREGCLQLCEYAKRQVEGIDPEQFAAGAFAKSNVSRAMSPRPRAAHPPRSSARNSSPAANLALASVR